MLSQGNRFFTGNQIDAEMILDDGATGAAAGYTSSGICHVSAANGYVDLGAGAPRSNFSLAVNWNIISADRTTGDETYTLQLEESDTSVFTAVRKTTNWVMVVSGTTDVEDEQLGPMVLRPDFRYIRGYVTLAGTTPILKIGKVWVSPVTPPG
jgi:hypothetical protein